MGYTNPPVVGPETVLVGEKGPPNPNENCGIADEESKLYDCIIGSVLFELPPVKNRDAVLFGE